MFYLEYCLEKNEELEEDCGYEYYVLHNRKVYLMNPWTDDHVYHNGRYITLKVSEI